VVVALSLDRTPSKSKAFSEAKPGSETKAGFAAPSKLAEPSPATARRSMLRWMADLVALLPARHRRVPLLSHGRKIHPRPPRFKT